MVYEGAIDKLTDEGIRSILSQSIRGSSSAALVSARHRPTCSPRTRSRDSSYRITTIYNVMVNKLLTAIA
jgi:hypothetical protein